MPTGSTTSSDFLLLLSGWTPETALELLDQLEPSYVVACGPGGGSWRIRPRDEALKLIGAGASDEAGGAAAALMAGPDVPGVEAGGDPDDRPALCVVEEDGRILGVHDSANLYRGVELSRDLAMGHDDEATLPRALEAVFPNKIALGSSAKLVLALTSELTGLSSLGFDLPAGAKLDVVAQARGGLAIVGPAEGTLTVTDEAVPSALAFKVVGKELGPGRIRIFAFHENRSLGRLDVSATTVPAGDDGFEWERVVRHPVGLTAVKQPNLTLLVFEDTRAGVTTLDIRLVGPEFGFNFKKYAPISFEADPSRYFRDLFTNIDALGRRGVDLPERLAAKGCHLFRSLLPADLQADLWDLRDRIETVQVQSEDPWIPWELVKPCGPADGGFAEGPFLCERYALTRWMPGVGQKPRLSFSNMAVVVPNDSGLAAAALELSDLTGRATGDRRVTRVPARFLPVRKALAQGVYDAFHFSGHGVAGEGDPNRFTVRLEGGDEFSAEELCGVVANLGKASPLVFMNACQIGRSGKSLTGAGGWASQFLRAGAGAFVGAYWSVYDHPARKFALVFYDRLLGGDSVGVAAREARAAIRADDDPTWLAYTVYADPAAGVESRTDDPGR